MTAAYGVFGWVLAIVLVATMTTHVSSFPAPKPQYGGGFGVGRLVLDELVAQEGVWKPHYDMVIVERIQGKPERESGLYVPDEDLPRLHLCRVLAVGPGREEENGIIAPMPEGVEVGSIVVAKNPWGIGPKDEETPAGKKISYMRSQDICAVLTGGFTNSEEKKIM